jgi:S-DNA-T family DNA segregation ATPase FtsK/SpoIIIE
LPASIEDRLIGCFGRASGCLILAVVAVLWASLLTWSHADPSLTHATGDAARNLLGAGGAVASDLLLETLGFATLALLMAPMFWGIELIASERVSQFRSKAAFFPLSVILLAGALSALPTAAGWPLQNGYGGILGDVILGFGIKAFGLINPDRAIVAAGLLFFVTGISALARGTGIELKDLTGLLSLLAWRPHHREPREPRARRFISLRAPGAGLRSRLRGLVDNRGRLRVRGQSLFGRGWPTGERDPMDIQLPGLEDTGAQRHAHRPLPLETGFADAYADRRPAPAAQLALEPADDADAFDTEPLADDTDISSRAIAERFAPANGRIAEAAMPAPQPEPRSHFLGAAAPRKADPVYKRPSLSMLKRSSGPKPGAEFSQTVLRGTARLLEDVLADFGVKGEVRDIKPGPVVTLFELEPARGTKTSRIISLADDIARSMSARSARVAVVPGRNAIGIELPNARREQVTLRDILETQAFTASDGVLPLALGKSIGGEPVVADLARMPHLLIAGTTGSGKSVGVNAMILSLLCRHSPDDCRLLMIDPKMLELSVYNGIPHLLTPVVTEPQKAVAALNWAVNEMEERYKRMSRLAVRNIDAFNSRVKGAKQRGEPLSRKVQTGIDPRTGQALFEREEMNLEPMPYIVIVVDEFADLMITAGKEIETAVQRLAQKARAAGIHLIMATQRPSVDIITGTIKANFPTRISFKVASKIDSRTILNEQGAEHLLGHGDMLFASGSGQMARVHGPFVSDEEVESIAVFLRSQGEPRYIEGIDTPRAGPESTEVSAPAEGSDDLYDRAVAVVLRDRKASTSYIQRRLSIGYNRAADLIERMEEEGLVSAPNQMGRREILMGEPTAA